MTRHTVFCLIALCVITTCLGAQTSFAQNLLVNPDFADGVGTLVLVGNNGQFVDITGWRASVVCGGASDQMIMVSETLYGANARLHPADITDAVRIRKYWASSYQDQGVLTQNVPAQPNAVYNAYTWVYNQDAGSNWAAADYSELSLEALDADMNPIAGSLVKTQLHGSTVGFVKLLIPSFTTPAGTAYVRFRVTFYLTPIFSSADGTVDDCFLGEGAANTASLAGMVTSGVSPLVGAAVEVGTKSTVTGPGGNYSLTGVAPSPGIRVRASKAGYYAQRKVRTLNIGVNPALDFDLDAVGDNLLVNAGFDDSWASTNWSVAQSGTTQVVAESTVVADGFNPVFFSGEESTCIRSTLGDGNGSISQMATVRPGGVYTARVKFRADSGHSASTLWGNTGDAQTAYLYVQEYDFNGDPAGAPHIVVAAETKDWESLELNFTAGSNVDSVVIGGYASLTSPYPASPADMAVFDSFELRGPAPVPNLLLNPDFAIGTVPSGNPALVLSSSGSVSQFGWTYSVFIADGQMILNSEDVYLSYNEPVYYHPFGSRDAVRVRKYYGGVSGDGYVSQTVKVVPGSDYRANAWVCARGNFGADSNDFAELRISEYDASFNMITEHFVRQTTANDNAKLVVPLFTTAANTQYVGYRLQAHVFEIFSAADVTFDDCSLYGPSAGPLSEAAIKGTIASSGGSPIAGATVTCQGKSGVTGAGGAYTIIGLSATIAGGTDRIRVTKPGYDAQSMAVNLGVGLNGPFDFILNAGSLLVNGGFDDAGITGWMTSTTTPTSPMWIGKESQVSSWYLTPFIDLGPDAASMFTWPGDSQGTIFQWISIVPNSSYTLSGRMKTTTSPGCATGVCSMWFDSEHPEQYAGIYAQEYNAAGLPVGAHWLYSNEMLFWESPSTTFTTGANTVFVEVGCQAYIVPGMAYEHDDRVTFDTMKFLGNAGPGLPPGKSVAEIKALSDGTSVILHGVVSASFDGFFYVEDANRICGIKVLGSAAAGDMVTVYGIVNTIDGERTIVANKMSAAYGGTVPAPLGMINRTLLTDAKAVGLYVVGWGTVSNVNGSTFTMSDGGQDSLKVYSASSSTLIKGNFVVVIGALGAEGAPAVPVLRATSVVKVN